MVPFNSLLGVPRVVQSNHPAPEHEATSGPAHFPLRPCTETLWTRFPTYFVLATG
jgi:hypothetical protein